MTASWTDADAVRVAVAIAQHTYRSMQIRTSRPHVDVFADRIRRAACAGDSASALETLVTGLQCDLSRVPRDIVARFLAIPPQLSQRILAWWFEQPRLVALLASTPAGESLDDALSHIELPASTPSTVMRRHQYDVPITVHCETSLSHGSDDNAGNAMLFRRIGVWTDRGHMMLPAYSGNALRGLLRDLLADHFLKTLDLSRTDGAKRVALWFFHTLFSGGALLSSDSAPKELRKALGTHGAVRSAGYREFRDMLPALSLLGCAAGDKLLPGKIDVGDLRPRCREWGTGTHSAKQLLTWEYLTRHDDSESIADDGEHQGMIAMTEVLRAGTILDGGIDYRPTIMDIERSALGLGLRLLQSRGHIGGQNRRDFGRVTLEISNMPDSALYEAFLTDRKQDIINYLDNIGALVAYETAAQQEESPQEHGKTTSKSTSKKKTKTTRTRESATPGLLEPDTQ